MTVDRSVELDDPGLHHLGREKGGWRSATVSVAGVERSVDLSLVPDAAVGDFVVTRSGYAISVLSRARAVETIEMLGLDPG